MRRFLKGLGLFLVIAAPAWGVVAMVTVFVAGGAPASAAAFGAILDRMFDGIIPTIVAGGGLWLLASIDERLERKV
ncbi:hypothetical protein [Brevundimonas sp.]|uniref:hypothetical protein n=1 Tax=Brevundimonas sp. TaxID=1871086 RepID=UPI002D34E98B|nr:hypothetical protein [Brevundimonas sp.]HYC96326.1 hypothetical protein [Brevundimonas sp.]